MALAFEREPKAELVVVRLGKLVPGKRVRDSARQVPQSVAGEQLNL